jgi:hypothetical protein
MMVKGHDGERLLISWWPESKQMESKEWGTRYILQRMPPVTYFL